MAKPITSFIKNANQDPGGNTLKMYIKIAVLLLVGSIIGMQNAAAN
jgi:hypothetical protein